MGRIARSFERGVDLLTHASGIRENGIRRGWAFLSARQLPVSTVHGESIGWRGTPSERRLAKKRNIWREGIFIEIRDWDLPKTLVQ